MANAYGSTTWKLDTTGIISVDKIRIKGMRLVPAAIGDDLLVSDSAGDSIWEVTDVLYGDLDGVAEINFGDTGHDTDGFVLTTLTSGAVLYVWII